MLACALSLVLFYLQDLSHNGTTLELEHLTFSRQ